MDPTRQNKISRLIQKEAAQYFVKIQGETPGAMLSVSEVRVAPDLTQARIYVSIFPQNRRTGVMNYIEENNKNIRFELAKKLRYQLRRMPELIFVLDDSLDYAEKIDQLLKN